MAGIGEAIGGAIGGIASIFTNSANNRNQKKINEANIRAQQAMNDQNIQFQNATNQKNIDFQREQYDKSKSDSNERWQKENDYNSPQAQMQRLKDAGLNPHLVYGSGATATGGSIDAPTYSTPNLQAPHVKAVDQGKPMQAYDATAILSNMLMAAQVEKTNAETKNINVKQEGQAFDLAVKQQLGLQRFETNLQHKMAGENYQNVKSIREFEAWAEAAYSGAKGDSMSIDLAGSYPDGKTPLSNSYSAQLQKGELTNKAITAGFNNTVEELKNIKRKGILYDDQHALNEIQKTINDFQGQLTKAGISPQSTQFLSVLVTLLKSAFGN